MRAGAAVPLRIKLEIIYADLSTASLGGHRKEAKEVHTPYQGGNAKPGRPCFTQAEREKNVW